jgi:Flp pilus assembly secretin CpaC
MPEAIQAKPLIPAALRVLFVLAFVMGSAPAQPPAPFVVQPPPNAAYPDYGPAGSAAAAVLRRQPARKLTFDRASLRDVLRYLADDAGIPFVGIPESDAANRRLVTFTMIASPFVALESVCRDNGIRLTYDNGVWFMRTVDEDRERRIREEDANKLIGKAYPLKYDPVDRVDFSNSADGTQPTSNSLTTIASASLPLQNSQRVFSTTAPRIVNEIRVMLGLPPIKYDDKGNVLGEKVQEGTNIASTAQGGQQPQQQATGSGTLAPINPTYVPPQKPQVIYNSDTNILWIVATREQHKWVEDYLLAVDQPQALIAIEVKFFETTRDPSKELGINWSGTMKGGYKIAATDIKATPSGSLNYNSGWSTGATSGTAGTGASVSAGSVTPGTGTGATVGGASARVATLTAGAPYSAILTAGDVALAIQAFMSDQKTSIVQYPRVLTVNNREVAITSALNTPINAGVTQLSSGGTTGQNVGTLAYLPTGTQINVLPKSLGNGQIAMTVAITISNILPGAGKEINLGTGASFYPETTQRVYNASLQVYSGYTLAVGGLEATDDSRGNNGIPFLQDIPGVGEFFKSKTRSRVKKNLIVFLTPTVIDNPKATRGISETPESVIPIRPNDPTPPAFTPDGMLVGGKDAVNAALAWFEFQAKWYKQINQENRTDKETIKQLRAVISSLRMLLADIEAMRENADPARAQKLMQEEDRAMAILTDLNRILSYASDNVM